MKDQTFKAIATLAGEGKDELSAAYAQHVVRANELKLEIDNGLVSGMDNDQHRALTWEYHEELLAAGSCLTMRLLLETVAG